MPQRVRAGRSEPERPGGAGLTKTALSHIPGWSYYGEKAAESLLGSKAIRSHRVLRIFSVMVGSVATGPVVWSFADIVVRVSLRVPAYRTPKGRDS